jgi:hypothetical protein
MQFNAFFIFILLFFLDTGSHYVTQAGFELTILLLNFPSAGVTGVVTCPVF